MHSLKLKIENYKSGFTLLELLIVIAIIGILTTTVLASVTNSRRRAQDAKIKSQLARFRSAAELYYANQTPNSYGTTAGSSCSSANTVFSNTLASNGSPNSYIGSAAWTGVSPAPTLTCNSNGTAYAVQATLTTSGEYWCVDSRGNSKLETSALGAATTCP